MPSDNVSTRCITRPRACYRVRGSLVGEMVLDRDGRVLGSPERTTPDVLSAESIRERLGLTRKEAEVALLVAEGKSKDDAARTLFLSPHTTRHHTEHLMQKLRIQSRAEVGPRILRA